MMFDKYGYFTGEIPEAAIADCTHAGDCSLDVEYWVDQLDFAVPREPAIRYLADFGAWSRDELEHAKDSTLAQRVFWIACGDIRESGEWFGLVH